MVGENAAGERTLSARGQGSIADHPKNLPTSAKTGQMWGTVKAPSCTAKSTSTHLLIPAAATGCGKAKSATILNAAVPRTSSSNKGKTARTLSKSRQISAM